MTDLTYSEPCGCKVVFIGESQYYTSRMTPGKNCRDHRGYNQIVDRDYLVNRAKAWLKEHLEKGACR